MHICSSIPQTKSVGMGLKNILTHRDNFALIDYERNVLLLSLHSHRQGLGYGQIIFNHMFYIHSSRCQLQSRRGLNGLGRSDNPFIQTSIILLLEFFDRFNTKRNICVRYFYAVLGVCIWQPGI